MGLEALSRGASRADLVEPKRPAAQAVRRNIEALDAEHAILHQRPLKHVLQELSARVGSVELPEGFDYIFLDPPYKQGKMFGLLVAETIAQSGLLHPDGIFIQETDAADQGYNYEEFGLMTERMKRYGNTRVTYYKRSAGELGR